jgi:thiamine biosynthesis lipoprotein
LHKLKQQRDNGTPGSPADQVLICVICVICGSIPAIGGSEIRYEASHVSMGSEYQIVVYGPNQAILAEACEQAFAEIDRLDDLLSNYKPGSELSRVNATAARGPVKVTPEFFDFLRVSDEFRRQTFGAFDITLGRGRLSLDIRNSTVEFTTPEVKLDPGGIGKGLAVDHAIDILKAAGIARALVSAGMSTINALGTPPGPSGSEQGWKITIRSPKSNDIVAATVYLKDNSLSTSAMYEKGRHIIDPRTRQPPENGVEAVSSLAITGTESDAITKCFFVLGRKGAADYMRTHPQTRALVCDPECTWVKP